MTLFPLTIKMPRTNAVPSDERATVALAARDALLGRRVTTMSVSNAGQLERVKSWLAFESNADDSDTAAGRVYDKLVARFSPLLGPAAVQVLFDRGAKLSRTKLACLAEIATVATELRERLHAHDRAITDEAAAALFGTFLALITILIGEQLAINVLRSTWPTIEEVAPAESKT